MDAKINAQVMRLHFADFCKKKSSRTVTILIDLTSSQFVMKIFEYLEFTV